MNKILKICLFLLAFCWFSVGAEAKINMFPKPRYIPALSFYGDSGKPYRLTDFNSDLLMAVIWSRSCGPCLEDLKHLGKFTQATMGKGIEVILISPEKEWRTPDEKRNFLRRLGANNMVSFADRNGRFRDGMAISVTPTAILVNKNGEEIGQITGSIEWDKQEVIDYMLKLKDETSQKLKESKASDEQNQE
ncbi:MAG: TlpA family protein disulfide reductase [Alphaproteobacteria bacterium]|nr:TlpA family protein disulfide reductase [Alphaproteobacteria bacterium]